MLEEIIIKSQRNNALIKLGIFIAPIAFFVAIFLINGFGWYIENILASFGFAIFITCLPLIMDYFMKCEITVTSKRVYGTIRMGKKVDLPLDMISSVSTNIFKSISVSTSSGNISFSLIENRDEIYDVISDLLKKRQENFQVKSQLNSNFKSYGSSADEIKKYKELLDSGIISQEEFDAKKKDLLGL